MNQLLDTRPRVCFEVEKVIGVSSDGNVKSYQVQWAPAWVSSFHLVGCEHLIQEFLQRQTVLEVVQKSKQQHTTENDEIMQQHGKEAGLVSAQSRTQMPETNPLEHNDSCQSPDPDIMQNDLPHEYENETGNIENCTNEGNPSGSSCVPQLYKIPTDEFDTAVIKIEDEVEGGDEPDGTGTNSNANVYLKLHISQNSGHTSTTDSSSMFYTQDKLNSLAWNSEEETVKDEHYNATHPSFVTEDDSFIEQSIDEQALLNLDTESAKKHNCMVCGKQFACPSGLKIHMRIHTGDRPYVCEHCGQGFAQQGVLQRHVRKHTGAKPFVCDVCGKGFTRNSNLKYHRMVAHT